MNMNFFIIIYKSIFRGGGAKLDRGSFKNMLKHILRVEAQFLSLRHIFMERHCSILIKQVMLI